MRLRPRCAEALVDAFPARRDQIDEQGEIVDPGVALRDEILVDPLETAHDAVQQPADLGEAPGDTRDLPAQPSPRASPHLLGQPVAEDVGGLGELGQLHARPLQLRLEQRRVEPARAGLLDAPSGPLQGVGAVLVHSIGKATLAVG